MPELTYFICFNKGPGIIFPSLIISIGKINKKMFGDKGIRDNLRQKTSMVMEIIPNNTMKLFPIIMIVRFGLFFTLNHDVFGYPPHTNSCCQPIDYRIRRTLFRFVIRLCGPD